MSFHFKEKEALQQDRKALDGEKDEARQHLESVRETIHHDQDLHQQGTLF
jgi:hypothetical protein